MLFIATQAEGLQHVGTIPACHKFGHIFTGGGTGFEAEISPATVHEIAFNGVIAIHDRRHIRGHIGQAGPVPHEFNPP